MRSEQLNVRAMRRLESVIRDAEALGIRTSEIADGGQVIDFGIEVPGGLGAGLELARVCLSDHAELGLLSTHVAGKALPAIQVTTDRPVEACLASQYAGWAIQVDDYFAMGSGPMRAAHGTEAIFDTIGFRESPDVLVGVLETRTLPPTSVFDFIAEKTGVGKERISLCVAPTASLAGGVQIVARSVETALHKLHELKFDLGRIASGWGVAPVPPVARDDLRAIGRTNDCVLYGATVTLWVHGDDESIESVGARVPSSASPDHGAPFMEIFERYDRDFYKINPELFSPAEVTFQNLDTGRSHVFGKLDHEVLARSLFD